MKLADLFAQARRANRTVFIPYIMAGDPNVETTLQLMQALERAGADLIELGVPYGDPLADGPTIAAAGARALNNGVAIGDVLRLASASALPVVVFSYYNPILQYGFDRFAVEAAAAGVAGVIVPDVALEEGDELRGALYARGIEMPLLIAPSTPLERAARIAEQATGFVYVVSRLGVTGAGTAPDFEPLLRHLSSLRTVTKKPLAVGFGVGTPDHVRAVAPFADGIIVGSALIDAYADLRGKAAAQRVGRLVTTLVEASRSQRGSGD